MPAAAQSMILKTRSKNLRAASRTWQVGRASTVIVIPGSAR
jgi:hypothetical protein